MMFNDYRWIALSHSKLRAMSQSEVVFEPSNSEKIIISIISIRYGIN